MKSDRQGFALAAADRSGLHPIVVLGWTAWETDDHNETLRRWNYMAWKIDVDLKGPYATKLAATDGGFFPGYFNMHDALDDFMRRLARPQYTEIRKSAGGPLDAQLEAIRTSDWGTHSITTRKYDDLYWQWLQWRLGEGWAKGLGPHNLGHRPVVFPQPVPTLWYVRLAAFLAKRKLAALFQT